MLEDDLRDVLDRVENKVTYDHMESRMLSLDCKVLHQACTDVLTCIAEANGDGQDVKCAGRSTSEREHSALDEAVVYGALCRVDKEAARCSASEMTALGQPARITSVKSDAFADRFAVTDPEIFYLLNACDIIALEFGPPMNETDECHGCERTFCNIMNVLEEADGPLSESEKQLTKALLRKHPDATIQVRDCCVNGAQCLSQVLAIPRID